MCVCRHINPLACSSIPSTVQTTVHTTVRACDVFSFFASASLRASPVALAASAHGTATCRRHGHGCAVSAIPAHVRACQDDGRYGRRSVRSFVREPGPVRFLQRRRRNGPGGGRRRRREPLRRVRHRYGGPQPTTVLWENPLFVRAWERVDNETVWVMKRTPSVF